MPAPSKAWVCPNRLLGLRVYISPGSQMNVSCERCVLSARSPGDRAITSREESYQV